MRPDPWAVEKLRPDPWAVALKRGLRKRQKLRPAPWAVAKIRGWANYHKHVVSGRTFGYVDTYIWNETWRWMRRRHRNKNTQWLKNKYLSKGSKPGRFATVVRDKNCNPRTYELIKAHSIHIQRHIKIKGDANPFDPEHQQYFRARRVKPTAIPVSTADEICSEITVNFPIGKRKQPGGPARLSLRNA